MPAPGDPQSLNRYSYVRNNPLRYVDPSGHRFEDGDNDANYSCGNGPGQAACVDSLETPAHDTVYPEGYGPLAGYPIGTTIKDIWDATLPGVLAPEEGTRTIGLNMTAGFLMYGNITPIAFNIDQYGNANLTYSYGGGSIMLATASLDIIYQRTNASHVESLLGSSLNIGGSGSVIIGGGAEKITWYDKGNEQKYNGTNYNLTLLGADLSIDGIPLPIEGHFGGTPTNPWTNTVNLFDVWGRFRNLPPYPYSDKSR